VVDSDAVFRQLIHSVTW